MITTDTGPSHAAVEERAARFAVALFTEVGNLMWPEYGLATEAEAEAYAARHNARPTRRAIVVEVVDPPRNPHVQPGQPDDAEANEGDPVTAPAPAPAGDDDAAVLAELAAVAEAIRTNELEAAVGLIGVLARKDPQAADLIVRTISYQPADDTPGSMP